MKKRIEFIDIAKGISLLLVMLFHVKLDIIAGEDVKDWFMIFCGPFCVSIFFLLSGMCFKFNTNPKQFFLGKVKGLLVPYFSFGIIIVIAFWSIGERSLNSFLMWLVELIVQKRYSTLWFLSTLFVGIIMFWGICCLANDNIHKIMYISVLISGLGFLYCYTIKKPLVWNIDISFCVQIFFAIGYYLKKKDFPAKVQEMDIKTRWMLGIIGFLLQVILASLNRQFGFEDYQMFYSRFGCLPLTLGAAIAGCIGVIFISSAISSKLLSFLGKNSLTFFALHQTLFIESSYLIYNIIGINYASTVNYTYIFCRIGTMIYCLIGCSLLYLLFKNTKLKFMLGK